MTAAPETSIIAGNARVLEREMAWLARIIDAAIRIYLGNECPVTDIRQIPPPSIEDKESGYGQMLAQHAFTFDERVILALSFAPYIRPSLLDPFLMKNPNLDRSFTEFGGVLSGSHSGFLPTLETAAFLLAGSDLDRRFEIQALFEPGSTLRSHNLLYVEDNTSTPFSAPLALSRDQVGTLTTGIGFQPAFTSSFPARRLTTEQDWDDLVLAASTMDDVEEIRAWIEHRRVLLYDWQLAKKIKPGFRSLF